MAGKSEEQNSETKVSDMGPTELRGSKDGAEKSSEDIDMQELDKNKTNDDDNKGSSDDNDAQSSESNDDSEEEGEGIMVEPLATTRSRRANAGNRMSKMIQDEEDEFYANLYGGFHEEEDDVDFDDSDENSYDSFESDFSNDEVDDIAPEHQVVENEPRKRSRVYKDPKPKGHPANLSGTSGPAQSVPAQPKPKPGSSTQSPGKIRGERSFRDSTKKKTEETIKNIQSERKKKKKNRNMEVWRPLSQEEMLAEAKITEEENIKSLEIYQKLELEKLKKIKQVKKTLPPPYVTYLSTTMPILNTSKRYTRNFITHVT